MGSVLSFSQFQKLNESDGPTSQFLQAAASIVDAFFSVYGEIVPKIGEYKDAISDLKSLEREKTLEGKGKKMQEIVAKVAKQVGEPYKSLQGDFTSLGKSFQIVWKTLIEDESAAKESEGIQKFIEDKIDSYIQTLISGVKEKNKEITKKDEDSGEGYANESFNTQEIGGYLLVERVIWQEREELANTLTTFRTQLESAIKSQKGVDATKDFRDKCRAARGKVDVFLSDLSDAKFDKLSRAEKKAKIDEILETVGKLKQEIQDAQASAFTKIGVESRIRKAVTDLLTKIKELQAKIQAIELKREEEGGEDDANDDESDDKEEGGEISSDSKDFKDLSVGGDNSSKKGKNRESIKSWQVLYNVINPKKKIAEDGLFGRADKKRGQTEDAIVYTANLLGSLLNKPELTDATKNGTILTQDLQALTKTFVDKILPEMKKKMSSSSEDKAQKSEEKNK